MEKQTYYVVMQDGMVQRMNEDRVLTNALDREPGTLFDDYNAAKGAINRTKTSWKKSMGPDFVLYAPALYIQRLEM